jgi:hypothetical protein
MELLDQPPQQLLPPQELGAIIRGMGMVHLDAQLAEGYLQELK